MLDPRGETNMQYRVKHMVRGSRPETECDEWALADACMAVQMAACSCLYKVLACDLSSGLF